MMRESLWEAEGGVFVGKFALEFMFIGICGAKITGKSLPKHKNHARMQRLSIVCGMYARL
jgi:hypothetical protein